MSGPMRPSEEEQLERDIRRQRAIEDAVQAADRIIMNRSDGSCEETNYITAKVAECFMHKAIIPYTSAILKKDMGL